jgi:HAD superfamily hydrolase (TIGR01549 family)
MLPELKETLPIPLKAILWDFDGVIVDSHDATIEYFQETLQHFGLRVPDPHEFDTLFGLKTIDIMRSLLPEMSEEQITPIFEYGNKKSFDVVTKIKLIAGADDVLANLQEKYRLGLITSRGKVSVTELFNMYQLGKFFGIVIDREDVTNHKPHPEGILKAMKTLGVNENEAIYIGDAKGDVLSAHAANIPCVIITDSRRKNVVEGADYLLNSITDLPDLINNLNP